MMTEFKSMIELVHKFRTEQDCIKHLETIRWAGNVVSPFDETSKVYICKGNKYKCKNTNKYFNVRTATIFEDTKIPLQKWFCTLYLFSAQGISSHQLARDLNITQKTAWFVLHRLRYAFDHPAFKGEMGECQGAPEIDEVDVGGNEKNKHIGKRNDKKTKQGTSDGKTPVIKSAGAIHIQPLVIESVSKNAALIIDDWSWYAGLEVYYNRFVINHGRGEYVQGRIHTNTTEGFWSQFKRGIVGIYHWATEKQLQSYFLQV
jgi:transposase-like protein